jgi:phosphoribosylpyrophosphate synthetase
MAQTESEKLMANFRKKINEGGIYVLKKNAGEVIAVEKVAYLANAEFVELNNVATINKAKQEQARLEKEQVKHKEVIDKIALINDDLVAKYEKQMAINKQLVSILKTIYGTQDSDLDVLLPKLESEVNE